MSEASVSFAAAGPRAHGEGAGIHVLLVEDHEMNADMLRRRLEKRGFRVSLAADGEQAIARTEQLRPDVVLMDLSLPVIDGWEATRRIKANPQLASIPVLALTAHAMSEDRQKALAAGCDDYDTKPVELRRLLRKISKLLGREEA